jgi:hypothetical protein
MTIEEHTKMPTCNLAKVVHKKWLQDSNKMICFKKVIVDDMICVFMQIIDYRAWSKRGSNGKGHDSTSVKFKATTSYRDPKTLANAMKSYPSVEDVNTMASTLEGSKLFGSTKQNSTCY